MTSPVLSTPKPASNQPVASGYAIFERKPASPQESHNIWRDSVLRELGYADEAAKTMEPHIGRGLYKGLWAVAWFYVGMDLIASARKAYTQHAHRSRTHQLKRTAEEVIDGSIFHGLATLLVPPLLLGQVHKFIERKVVPNPKIPPQIRNFKYLSSLACLLAIPVVGKPIDMLTDWALDHTFRPLIGLIHPPKPDLMPELHRNRAKAKQVTQDLQAPDTFYNRFQKELTPG